MVGCAAAAVGCCCCVCNEYRCSLVEVNDRDRMCKGIKWNFGCVYLEVATANLSDWSITERKDKTTGDSAPQHISANHHIEATSNSDCDDLQSILYN